MTSQDLESKRDTRQEQGKGEKEQIQAKGEMDQNQAKGEIQQNQDMGDREQEQEKKLAAPPRRVLVFVIPGLILITAVIAGNIFVQYEASEREKANSLWMSGRIEGPETHISAAVPAQVRSVTVDEGDHVSKGQLLILLDDHSLRTKLQDVGSAMSAAQGAQAQARHSISGLRTEAAAVKAQPVGLITKMFGGLVGRKRKEMQKEMEFRMKMAQAEAQVRGAQGESIKARAARDEVTSNLSYFRINSPIDGVCTTKSVEQGEMTAPGRILLTLVDTSKTYMRGFVAEGDIGKIRIGEKAKVFLDSAPKQPLDAKVVAIDPEASFTPENVYFKQDRVKQVFGVKVMLEQSNGGAKPGMPADAQIMLAATGQKAQ